MAHKLMIPEIFEACAAAKTKKEKIDILQAHDHPSFRKVMRAAYDPKYEWDLPEGQPPLKVDRDLPKGYAGASLYTNARLFYLFEKAYTKVDRKKKEVLFINFLEGLHWTEVDFVCELKDHKLAEKYKVSAALVKEALPGIFESDVSESGKTPTAA